MEQLKKKILLYMIGNRRLKDILVEIVDAQNDASQSVIGVDIDSAGGDIELTANMTLEEALQAIVDAVDPA